MKGSRNEETKDNRTEKEQNPTEFCFCTGNGDPAGISGIFSSACHNIWKCGYFI